MIDEPRKLLFSNASNQDRRPLGPNTGNTTSLLYKNVAMLSFVRVHNDPVIVHIRSRMLLG